MTEKIDRFHAEKIGALPPGGTVIDMACSGDTWLAASPAGLFRKEPGADWRPVVQDQPFGRLTAVAAAGRTVLAGGIPAGLARSLDGGARWQRSWVDQTQTPVTALSISPNFNRDGIALAGTDGDGVLRSTDGGRYWNLANFGLRHFHVFDLAAAPEWGRRETVFAGTDGGVYESPNGGRAWRALSPGLGEKAVLSLAASPNFDQDRTVFAGTEADGLFRSQDGGRSWQALHLPGPEAVNRLQFHAEGLLAGNGEGKIYRSANGGESWEEVAASGAALLSLASNKEQVYAGLHLGGLLVSNDGGLDWQPDASLTARRLVWLTGGVDGSLWVAGPEEGPWSSEDGGRTWRMIEGLPGQGPVYGVAVVQSSLLAARPDGVWIWEGADWRYVLPAAETRALAGSGSSWFAGSASGQLWRSTNGGNHWEGLALPTENSSIAALAVSPGFPADRTVLAASVDASRRFLQLWRSRDAGDTWEFWLEERTDWTTVRLSPSGPFADATTLAFGVTCLAHTPQGWRRAEITTEGAPVTALFTEPQTGLRLAAAGESLFSSRSGVEWNRLELPAGLSAIAGMEMAVDGRSILALTVHGQLWRLNLIS